MIFNSAVLREISFQITSGNPWWGMLLANEYLKSSNPIRSALIFKFRERLPNLSHDQQTLANTLIAGRCKNSLSNEQLAKIGSRAIKTAKQNIRTIASVSSARPTERIFRNSDRRRAQRVPNAKPARFTIERKSLATARRSQSWTSY